MFAGARGEMHKEGKTISNCPISKCFSKVSTFWIVDLPPFQLGNSSTTNTDTLTTLTCRWQGEKFLRKVKKPWDVFVFLQFP